MRAVVRLAIVMVVRVVYLRVSIVIGNGGGSGTCGTMEVLMLMFGYHW